jgi:hypothetical protein
MLQKPGHASKNSREAELLNRTRFAFYWPLMQASRTFFAAEQQPTSTARMDAPNLALKGAFNRA